MKHLILAALLLASPMLATNANAYMIGGMYARLLSCNYGQVGYQFGYTGTYDANGTIYQVYFGSNYCQY